MEKVNLEGQWTETSLEEWHKQVENYEVMMSERLFLLLKLTLLAIGFIAGVAVSSIVHIWI